MQSAKALGVGHRNHLLASGRLCLVSVTQAVIHVSRPKQHFFQRNPAVSLCPFIAQGKVCCPHIFVSAWAHDWLAGGVFSISLDHWRRLFFHDWLAGGTVIRWHFFLPDWPAESRACFLGMDVPSKRPMTSVPLVLARLTRCRSATKRPRHASTYTTPPSLPVCAHQHRHCSAGVRVQVDLDMAGQDCKARVQRCDCTFCTWHFRGWP
jgi:hypothetical protein